MRVVWTEWAVRQLESIERYVATESAAAAERLVTLLVNRAESLRTMARRGRVVPEVGRDDIREIVQGNYRIIYVVRRARIDILSVLERHRLLREEDIDES